MGTIRLPIVGRYMRCVVDVETNIGPAIVAKLIGVVFRAQIAKQLVTIGMQGMARSIGDAQSSYQELRK